jgi:hypothetical protein
MQPTPKEASGSRNYPMHSGGFVLNLPSQQGDEDITSTCIPAAPSLQAPPSGPITRARARELNYVMVLKNEGYVAGFGLRTNVNL